VRLQAEDDAITAQNDAIWGLIAPFLANQIARITIDFKMSIITYTNCVCPTLQDGVANHEKAIFYRFRMYTA
jgi:hypothetical protein